MAVRKSKTASVAKSAYQRTPQEAAVVNKLQGKRAEEAPRLKVSTVGNILKIETHHPDRDIGNALLMEALATTDIDFLSGLVTQLANAVDGKADEQRLNFMFSVVKNIKARDQIEAMLAAQMAAVHVATMRSSRSLAEAESLEHRDSAERTLNKLMRTFAMQMGALKQFIIAEFVAHSQRLRFWELESRPRQYHQAAIAGRKAVNSLNLLPLSAA
jgi:hypothetical protein